MATDFFDRQDHARRLTQRLLLLFSVAVATIIVAVYVVLAMAFNAYEAGTAPVRGYYDDVNRLGQDLRHGRQGLGSIDRLQNEPSFGIESLFSHVGSNLWRPQLFLWATLGATLVIALGSLYKMSELSAGGENIALMLGGRPIDPQTKDLAEKRLRNVVEEMALASGIPVPPVYVLDHESSINAFAAGHQPGDAVVAVSAGCLRYLTREELQGVMAHEFSHILNGDMRLNLRLIGVIYGIVVLSILGYYCMRSAGAASSGSSKRGEGAAGILVVGMALWVLGSLGVFFGKLIKAAINRQREFLADASAVQFTRYPAGIAGALKKIGGLQFGSRIRDAHAAEVSHMFFSDSFAGAFFNLLATHPPLTRRIQALEPDFDGRFPKVEPLTVEPAPAAKPVPAGRPGKAVPPIVFPLPAVLAGGTVSAMTDGTTAAKMDVKAVARRVGQPDAEDLRHAGRMMDAMPAALRDAAREPFTAQALVYALLLSRDDESTRAEQWKMLRSQITYPLYQELELLAESAVSLPAADRLPLVDLAIPALKRCSAKQYGQFRQVVEALVHADGKVDLFEYSLRMVLFSYLDVHFGQARPVAMRYRTLRPVAGQVTMVLSTLAYVGHATTDDARRAFEAGTQALQGRLVLLPRDRCSLRAFDEALAELTRSTPRVKRAVLSAVAACIGADGKVTLAEGELLRAIAAVLGCPIPPLDPAAADNESIRGQSTVPDGEGS